MKPFFRTAGFAFFLGFLFGTVGLWVLAALSLAAQPIEFIVSPLFAIGKAVSGYFAQNGSMGDAGVVAMFFVNGIVYGCAALLLRAALRKKR